MAYAKKIGLFFEIGFLLFVFLFSFPKSVEAANRLDFFASSTNITAGTNVTLDWEAIGFDWSTCTGGGGTFAGAKGFIGSEVVTPATTTTYTLSCNFSTDYPRIIFKSITVTVSAIPIPTISLSASANPLPFGGSGSITPTIFASSSLTISFLVVLS